MGVGEGGGGSCGRRPPPSVCLARRPQCRTRTASPPRPALCAAALTHRSRQRRSVERRGRDGGLRCSAALGVATTCWSPGPLGGRAEREDEGSLRWQWWQRRKPLRWSPPSERREASSTRWSRQRRMRHSTPPESPPSCGSSLTVDAHRTRGPCRGSAARAGPNNGGMGIGAIDRASAVMLR